jgi:hypothetical protein
MENAKHRIDLRLTTEPQLAIKQFSMLNCKAAKYIHGLYMIEQYKTRVVMSKPIYVGCAILDLSKLTMLKFHYDVIENSLTIHIMYLMVILIVLYIILNILIFMNGLKKINNILIYHIINEKICKMLHIRKRLGCFKDELNGMVMSEHLGLNPKYYAHKFKYIKHIKK